MSTPNSYRQATRLGLIFGVVIMSTCMIGVIEGFSVRYVITDLLTLGQLLLFVTPLSAGYLAVRRYAANGILTPILVGLISGFMTGVPVFALIVLSQVWTDIRDAFINVSPALISIITLGQENPYVGGLMLVAIFTVLGLTGAIFALLPGSIRRATLIGLSTAVIVGIMSEIFVNVLRRYLDSDVIGAVFGTSGLTLPAFLILALIVTIVSYWWRAAGKRQYGAVRSSMSPQQTTVTRRIVTALLIFFLFIVPSILGVYLMEIINNVGLYILMGLGLNIAIGLAGLLDLGYVTNFAIGAYTMALLTSASQYGIEAKLGVPAFSFWIALPICVLAAMLTGFILALPVLRMRGDYLAIATLGFGEIIRVLARSDALKPLIGGAQGILQIPAAKISGVFGLAFAAVLNPINNFLSRFGLHTLQAENGEVIFDTPLQLYFLVFLACLLMYFVSQRLNNSRTGRRWMAMREDEDVANAVGINTTNAKVIAFTLSAASGGLAGAIFAAKIGSIFPHSFSLLISINVLSLIIVGGLGSIPGVIVGAFALIGIPELLREFAEFRLLIYGIALIVMMLVRPEGLWPSEVRRRELHQEADDAPPDGTVGEAAAAGG